MALLRFISLVTGSVMLLQGGYGQKNSGPAAPSDPTAVVADDCLDSMNKARTMVGYVPFTATNGDDMKLHPIGVNARKANEEGTKKFWTAFCKRMQDGKLLGREAEEAIGDLKGTVAYAPQQQKDCAAAVEYWKRGFAKFGSGLPPAFGKTATGDKDAPYDSDLAVSFVALYNPKENPNVECVFLTCPAQSPANPAPGESGNRRLEAVAEARALVCLSHPDALVPGKQPYREEEWKKIADVFAPESSASIAMPTFLALVAAAVGLAVI